MRQDPDEEDHSNSNCFTNVAVSSSQVMESLLMRGRVHADDSIADEQQLQPGDVSSSSQTSSHNVYLQPGSTSGLLTPTLDSW